MRGRSVLRARAPRSDTQSRPGSPRREMPTARRSASQWSTTSSAPPKRPRRLASASNSLSSFSMLAPVCPNDIAVHSEGQGRVRAARGREAPRGQPAASRHEPTCERTGVAFGCCNGRFDSVAHVARDQCRRDLERMTLHSAAPIKAIVSSSAGILE